jgi:hypothetical protein
MTPAEIAKLTEQANRGRDLMAQSAKSGERAGTVFDRYEQTLSQFNANVERVAKEESALKSAMIAMGNAEPVLEQAFQDSKKQEDGVRPTNGSGISTQANSIS